MHIFNTVVKVIRKPFPKGENRLWYYRSLGILSLFAIVFLYIYKPFGMHQLKNKSFLIYVGFGAMTFLGGTVYELIIYRLKKFRKNHTSFTFGKWLLNNLGAMLCISLANFLFARFTFFGYVEWSLFPTMIYGTFMVGIIPLIMVGGFFIISQKNKDQNITNEVIVAQENSSNTKHQLLFNIPILQIRYIEALQNYVKIAYIDNDGHLKIQIERATLKEIQTKVKDSSILKCHRSYLVNVNAIINTVGNSQGLSLTLSDCDMIIPVSRTWVPIFRKK